LAEDKKLFDKIGEVVLQSKEKRNNFNFRFNLIESLSKEKERKVTYDYAR
jgi:hypothetical protein